MRCAALDCPNPATKWVKSRFKDAMVQCKCHLCDVHAAEHGDRYFIIRSMA